MTEKNDQKSKNPQDQIVLLDVVYFNQQTHTFAWLKMIKKTL